ncbi:LolA family protein [Pararcticibacter amylolyticus]|uniref:Gliding motility protein n=1 Tax=Pararcticibacter amylolyticus TaxID=2173175 RepID=A0A2U2PE96_9SPHI|nr:outer membrane lipoprotein carrier protein LolA [Pararcticibacter amylolyticus]PWG79725.1 gliding motility protein [Pararcticibacter amylolyticus]
MRRIFLSALVIIFSVFASEAQTDAKAKAILAAVSKKYSSYSTIKTDFTYTINNPQAKINQTVSGTLYTQPRTNKYFVSMNDQELISDGKNQWSYLKADKEVQLSAVDNSSKSLNPAKIFTIYEKGFKYLYTGDVKQGGRVYHVIDLSPTDNKQSFFKVRLNIDKLSRQITKALIFDKNGSHYTYTIKTFTPNVKVAESFFAFDPKKHPGVELVDLR